MTRPRMGKRESRETNWVVAGMAQEGGDIYLDSMQEVGSDQIHNLFSR